MDPVRAPSEFDLDVLRSEKHGEAVVKDMQGFCLTIKSLRAKYLLPQSALNISQFPETADTLCASVFSRKSLSRLGHLVTSFEFQELYQYIRILQNEAEVLATADAVCTSCAERLASERGITDTISVVRSQEATMRTLPMPKDAQEQMEIYSYEEEELEDTDTWMQDDMESERDKTTRQGEAYRKSQVSHLRDQIILSLWRSAAHKLGGQSVQPEIVSDILHPVFESQTVVESSSDEDDYTSKDEENEDDDDDDGGNEHDEENPEPATKRPRHR